MPRVAGPMLARSDAIPRGSGRLFELERDGLRSVLRTHAAYAAAAAAVLLVGAVVLGGCGGGASPELQALKSDPLGRYEPPGGRLIDSTERDGGSTLGKPVYPEYRRSTRYRRGIRSGNSSRRPPPPLRLAG